MLMTKTRAGIVTPMPTEDRHKFKWMVYKGRKIRIDRDIAPLLSNMWELGIGTTNCCQAVCARSCKHKTKITKYKDGSSLYSKIKTRDCKDRVWIVFDSARSFEKFLNVVAVYEKWKRDKPEGMYEHIQGFTLKSHPHDVWEVIPYFDNLGVMYHEERMPLTKANGFPKGRKTIGILVEDSCKKNQFKMMPQLWFPRKHLEYVEERIRLALDK